MVDRIRLYKERDYLEKRFKENPNIDEKDLINSIAEDCLVSSSIVKDWTIRYGLIPMPINWEKRKCEGCGKEFLVKLIQGISKAKYCSIRCPGSGTKPGHHYIWIDGKRIRREGQLKEGQEKVNNGGYVEVYTRGHFRPKHRVVFEKYLGRKLTKGEVIHHRNGNKADNKLKNLQLLTNTNHSAAVETKHSEDISKYIYYNGKAMKLWAKREAAYSDIFMFASLLIMYIVDKKSLMNSLEKKNMLIKDMRRFIDTLENSGDLLFRMIANLIDIKKAIKLLNSIEKFPNSMTSINHEKLLMSQFELFKDN